MKDQIRVVVVEDHRLFREALCATLGQEERITIVGEATNGLQVMYVVSDVQPDVAVFDAILLDLDVIKIVSQVREKSPATKSLILTTMADESILLEAIKAGVKGYVSKDAGMAELIKAILTVHQGELWIERKILAKFFDGDMPVGNAQTDRDRKKKGTLTPREHEILSVLMTGCTNREIAQRLFISEKTVKCHLNRIFHKIKVKSRLEATLYAIKQGVA